MKKQIERECLSTLPVQTKQGEKAVYARFQLKDAKTGDYFSCIAFSENADALAKELTESGISIIVRGKQDDDSFIINSFKIKRPNKEILSEDINIRIAGSNEKLIDLKKRIKDYYEGMGQVKVKWGDTWQWFDKEDCVEINGKWWHKVEFIIEQLGSEYVNRRYRDFVGDVKSLVTKGFSQKDYDNFKETLLMEAKGEKAMVEPMEQQKPQIVITETGEEIEIL